MTCRSCAVLLVAMEMVAVEESSGGNCMVARGASAVRPQDTVAGKAAEQQCEHFSIR